MSEKGKCSNNIFFYTLSCGRTMDIFLDWNLCKENINKYQCSSHLSFSSLEEAVDFLYLGKISHEQIVIHTKHKSLLDYRELHGHTVPPCSALKLKADTVVKDGLSNNTEANDIVSSAQMSLPCANTPDIAVLKQTNVQSCCKACNNVDEANMIAHNACKRWLHYRCTDFLSYQLYLLCHTSRKFQWSFCTDRPRDFLMR